MTGNARAQDRDGEPAGAGAATGAPRVTALSEGGSEARDRDARPDDRAASHAAQREDGEQAGAPALGRNPEVEDAALPPHEPGSMDISAHEETYAKFIRITIRTVITIFVVLILLALINA